MTAARAVHVREHALKAGGRGWVAAVVAADLALDAQTWRSTRRPTVILPPTPYVPVRKCAAFFRWKLAY